MAESHGKIHQIIGATKRAGFDLSNATKLTFWARGEDGGEVVSFKLGILGADKKYSDSDHAELPDVVLTKEWKQYSIDLSGKNLASSRRDLCG